MLCPPLLYLSKCEIGLIFGGQYSYHESCKYKVHIQKKARDVFINILAKKLNLNLSGLWAIKVYFRFVRSCQILPLAQAVNYALCPCHNPKGKSLACSYIVTAPFE